MYNQSQKFNNNRERIGCLNGSYLNSSGQLVLSNPFEPRMNYIYASSTSSLGFDKRLIESSKKNYYTAKSITGDVSLYTKEYLIPGVDVWYSSTGNIFLDQDYTSEISSMSSSTNFTTSFFIKKIGGTASEINFTRRWYWAPGLVVNLDTGVIVSGNSPDIIFQYYGNGWYRIGGWMCGQGVVSGKNVALVDRVNSTDDIEVIVTCNMCEELDSTNTIKTGTNTYYWPSSWIPYECTRKEYVYGTENEGYPSCGRNSIATYFDSTGTMQVAEPYILRPKYTYTAPTSSSSSGTWTQNGNLEENETFNIATSYNSNITEVSITNLCSYDKVYQTAKDSLIVPNGYDALDNTSYVASIFIHRPSSTATYLDIWWVGSSPDGTTYSITNDCLMNNGNTVSNYTSSTWKIGCVTYGDWTRVSLFLPLSSASHGSQWAPLWCPRNGYVNWTCIMVELYQGSYAPSSWIPYGMTRKSDYDKIDYISDRSSTATAIDSAGNIVLFEPYELRPKNVCTVSSYTNYCDIESATISDSGVSFTTISTPSNFISGNFISVITNNEVGWPYVKIPTTTTGLCKLSFFINITSGIEFYVSCQNAVNYYFNIDSSGNITTTSSPKNLVLQKMNNDYWYIEFDIIVSQFQESIYIGDPNKNQTLKFNIGNIKLLKLYDEQNYQGILIENESYNYCSGGTPTTTTSCSISSLTYQNQQAWLIESPNIDQWSEISFSHKNTNTSLICTASVFIKPLEDGTIAINNGTTYNSSFTFSNGTIKYNNDGGTYTLSAGYEYIGNGIWRIYQVRNDGFILDGNQTIGLQNSSPTLHFPKCIVFCFQLESGEQPSSWIPYEQTRSAD